jgi:hypothetical protein
MAKQPCEAAFNKYEDAYRDWERKDRAEDRWSAAYVAADIATVTGCVASFGTGCAALIATAIAVLTELLNAEDEENAAAGEANGAFAEYLVCAMQHKNYYKGTID